MTLANKHLLLSEFIFSCFLSVNVYALSNGIKDSETLSVVKLTNASETQLCSGTIVGQHPLTVLTAFHCLNLAGLENEIYLDDRENLSPESSDLFTVVSNNAFSSGSLTFAHSSRLLKKSPLGAERLATKVILPRSLEESESYLHYQELSKKRKQLQRSLLTLKEQLKAQELPLNLESLLQGQSPAKQREVAWLRAQIAQLEAETFNLEHQIQQTLAPLNGIDAQHLASDVALLLFENYRLEGSLEELLQNKQITPVLDGVNVARLSEVSLHGYGRVSLDSTLNSENARRRKVQSFIVPSAQRSDLGFLKFLGSSGSSPNQDKPRGTGGAMLEGDSGGSAQAHDAVVAVYSHYNPHQIAAGLLEFFAVRVDSAYAQDLFDQAKLEGADILFKNIESSEVYRK